MHAMWSMLGVALVAGVATAGSARQCPKVSLNQCTAAKDGCWWWDGIIAKRCVYTNTGAGGKTKQVIEAFRCKTAGDGKKDLKIDGPAVRDGYFGYECEKEGDALHVRPVECYTPDNKRLTAGKSHEHGGWTYSCEEDEDKQKNPIVKMERFKKTYKCSYKGKEYKNGQTVKSDDKVSFLRCRVKSGKAEFELGGCVMKRSNGQTVLMNLFSEREGKYCQTGPKANTAEVFEHGDKCTYKGKKYNIGQYFFADQMRLRCVHNINTNSYKRCLATQQRAKCPRGTRIDTKGCQYDGTKYLNAGQARKLSNGRYVVCEGRHASGPLSRTCKMETISASNEQRCSDGRDINAQATADNVRSRCVYRKGGSRIVDLSCVSDSGRAVGRNRIHGDKSKGFAHRCEQVNGRLKWVKLTDEQYKKWAAGNSNVFTAGGGSGSGNAQENDNAPPTCKEGHEWSQEDKQCLDVNECATGDHDCLDDENCHNLKGGFVCKCKEGLTRLVLNNKCEITECGCPTEAVSQR